MVLEAMPLSVIKSQRSTSDMQFLHTARELESRTRRKCLSAPKRFTFYGLQELWLTARHIYSYVKQGNSVYPTTQHEAQMRRDMFITAGCLLQDYTSQLELLTQDNVLTVEANEELSPFVDEEIKLIKAVIKADKARYADLP